MKYSIRTRLTLSTTFVFLFIFFFILIAGAIALYLGLNEEIDRDLRIEEKRMSELFESEFQDLLAEKGESRKPLRDKFVEELNEIYRYKRQFVIFSLESHSGRRIYAGGKLKNVQLLLPKGFLSQKNGYYNQRFDGNFYRVRVTRKDWGTLALGAKNETFFEVADEFKEIFLIGIPLIIILIFIGGRFLAKRAMRPVVTAAETAKQISLSNLDQRLSEYNKNDEFGVLVQTLNQMIATIERGVQQIQQFTQDAAHELRTPLTILRGELELLYQQKNPPGNLQQPLQKSLDRAISMGKIVDNLMLLAQSDAGNYPLKKNKFNLSRLLQDIVEDTRIMTQDRPIEVLMKVNDPVDFYGDHHLIERLLLNLADNAIKFTERRKIEFSLQKQDDRIEISISDTGIGISPHDLPHIFNRFYRAIKARSDSPGGSGLGLAICKWITTSHNGKIKVENRITGGTKIVIDFPAPLD